MTQPTYDEGAEQRFATRRQAIAGIAIALTGIAVEQRAAAGSRDQDTALATGSDDARTSLRQTVTFNASPQRIYDILLGSKQFAAFTGMGAKIDPKVGGAFTMFGTMIGGRNVELIPGKRIVQAWRPAHWDEGVYSIVRFELKADGAGCSLVLDHTGFPEGEFKHLDPGWKSRYWEPIKKYIG